MFNRRFLLLLLVFAALVRPLGATWSIILVDVRTGEIAIGSATCLEYFDLQRAVPVIVVGHGAAAAQSNVDSSGANRMIIHRELSRWRRPTRILQILERNDVAHQTRQYGILDTRGRGIGFTGNQAGSWAGERSGQVGTIVYQIQGNVLTGAPVLDRAADAIRAVPGGLADKLMAAMQAARSMGGDGRCSCPRSTPDGCGSPPASFTKSAHIGFMTVARFGDTDGTCNGNVGCANGSYYLNFNISNQGSAAVDPVLQLQAAFDAWSQRMIGRPDHYRSTMVFDHSTLPNDGTTSTLLHIVLRDRLGIRNSRGGATIRVGVASDSMAQVTLGTPWDHGDGSYSVPVVAGATAGQVILDVQADDGSGAVSLWPRPELTLSGEPLWSRQPALSVSRGGTLDFVLHPGPLNRGRLFALLMSNSGSYPGLSLGGGLVLPLNPDLLFTASVLAAQRFELPGLIGIIPPSGRVTTSIPIPPGAWGLASGSDITFAYAMWDPIDRVSNPVYVDLVR